MSIEKLLGALTTVCIAAVFLAKGILGWGTPTIVAVVFASTVSLVYISWVSIPELVKKLGGRVDVQLVVLMVLLSVSAVFLTTAVTRSTCH